LGKALVLTVAHLGAADRNLLSHAWTPSINDISLRLLFRKCAS
jgi:hypothetical protein